MTTCREYKTATNTAPHVTPRLGGNATGLWVFRVQRLLPNTYWRAATVKRKWMSISMNIIYFGFDSSLTAHISWNSTKLQFRKVNSILQIAELQWNIFLTGNKSLSQHQKMKSTSDLQNFLISPLCSREARQNFLISPNFCNPFDQSSSLSCRDKRMGTLSGFSALKRFGMLPNSFVWILHLQNVWNIVLCVFKFYICNPVENQK